jgi:hypothetical protein
MNERIKELANQCWESHLSPIGEWYTEFDEEKFAVLLIKDCADCLDDGDMEGLWVRNVLYNRFGIED